MLSRRAPWYCWCLDLLWALDPSAHQTRGHRLASWLLELLHSPWLVVLALSDASPCDWCGQLRLPLHGLVLLTGQGKTWGRFSCVKQGLSHQCRGCLSGHVAGWLLNSRVNSKRLSKGNILLVIRIQVSVPVTSPSQLMDVRC